MHRAIETRLIELNALIARGINHEVQRQTEGVIQLEGPIATVLNAVSVLARNQWLEIFFKLPKSQVESIGESFLLRQNHICNALYALNQFGIRVLHQVADRVDHLVHKRFRLPQQASMTNAATQDLAQHISPPFIGG